MEEDRGMGSVVEDSGISDSWGITRTSADRNTAKAALAVKI